MNLVRRKLTGLGLLWRFDNRWRLMVDRLVRPHAVSTYRVGAVRIDVDHDAGDANGVRDVFATPMYRDLLARAELPGDLRVLDVGAHIGSFTLLLVALGHRLVDATCVEMNPQTHERLRANLAANALGQVRAVHAAVCGDGSDRVVELGRGDTGDSLDSGSPTGGTSAPQVVPGTTLDRLIDDVDGPIDLCKLDVEGAEYEIFGEPHHRAIRRCRYVLIEVHERPAPAPSDLLDRIGGLGFSIVAGAAGPVGVHLFRNTLAPA